MYELYAHTAVGRTAGLPDEVIQAIKEHRRPEGVSEAARAAYRLVESLMLTYDVPDAVYTAAVAALGANGVVAVVQLAGHYITVCAMLNAFRIPTPDG
ncbi:MAG TPA: hypothetical protein VGU66_13085 [Candidatus Elarobacter sp.]|nr:hypothetical protein [Candidatus Elarobacter sp.]